MGIPSELPSLGKKPQLDFTEPAPPSPSTYLDLPRTPSVDNAEDHLSYISRMLMEDDTVDNLYNQYPNHPMLLVAEQPFAQILSANATSDALTTWPCSSVQHSSLQTPEYYHYSDMVASEMLPAENAESKHVHQDASSLLMNGSLHEAVVEVEPHGLLPAKRSSSSSSISMEEVSMAFCQGMEEATKLLPSVFSHMETLDRDWGRKKRLQDKDDVDVCMGRSSKQKAAVQSQADSESEEEAAACKMLDRLMLNDESSHVSVQQELLSSMELEKPRGRRPMTVDLHALLIRCAEAVSTNDQRDAVTLLQWIRHHSSPAGDGMQRLAHWFAQGLEARLMGTGSQMYKSLLAKWGAVTSILKMYQMYIAASSNFPMTSLLSTKIAYNAVAGKKKLHIVHYGLGHGFHLPELLRMLSSREGGPPEVRLTAIDNPLPGAHPGQVTEETGRRLGDCARRFRVPFKFRAITAKLEVVCADDLDIDPNEVLVVISLFCFKNLMDESVIIDRPNPRDTVLKNITKMRPKVFVHQTVNPSYRGSLFVSRFREALNSFAAAFDVMDTIMPRENQNRLLAEQWLAMCAMNIVACEGMDRVSRPENYKQWQVRNQRAGLRQLPLDPDMVQISKDRVKKEYRKYIMINEDHGWLLTGWKGRVLAAFSTWTADDRSGLCE